MTGQIPEGGQYDALLGSALPEYPILNITVLPYRQKDCIQNKGED